MLRDVPSWLLHFTKSELTAAVSYTLTFMLFESILVFAFILILGLLIPKRWIGNAIVPFCFVLLIELTGLAITIQYLTLKYILYRRLLIIAAILLAIVIAFGVSRIQKLNNIFIAIIKRLTILTFLYIFVDIIALFVVFTRIL
jgi:hypothetical protein